VFFSVGNENTRSTLFASSSPRRTKRRTKKNTKGQTTRKSTTRRNCRVSRCCVFPTLVLRDDVFCVLCRWCLSNSPTGSFFPFLRFLTCFDLTAIFIFFYFFFLLSDHIIHAIHYSSTSYDSLLKSRVLIIP